LELDSDVIPDILYKLPDCEVLLILAPIEGEPMHLCGICGFVLSGPGEPCPHCALTNEAVAAAIDAKRVANSAAERLKGQREPVAPHPLEAELHKIQNALDALEECPPLWWADKVLWRGLRWIFRMRQRSVRRVLKSLVESAEHNTDNREPLKVLREWPPLWWTEWLERVTGFQ
jgi:hypothetical protein